MLHSELLDLSTQTPTLFGHIKFISVPRIMSNHRASKFLKHFLILLSLIYFDKLAVSQNIGKVLISSHDQAFC